MYRVALTNAARKFLDNLPDEIAARILSRLDALKTVPRPPDVKKLKGRDGWRIRVGDYRVIYAIQDAQLIILVIQIGHRREIFR